MAPNTLKKVNKPAYSFTLLSIMLDFNISKAACVELIHVFL